MSVRVWVPYPWLADDLPSGVAADLYDGTGAPPPSMADVEFYVLPYMQGIEPARLMSRMPRLKVAQTLTAGVDGLAPLLPPGVTLCNAKGVHDASTAELAVALVLAAQRGIPDFVRAAADGRWDGRRRESLADRTVLILGYGSVGAAVERRLAGFECTVVRVARHARDGVHGLADLPHLLPRADVVVVTVPMTAETTGLVDARFLAALPDGALLVNVSRGAVVVTEDLRRETSSGRLRAALDVTDPEPLPPDHPLWRDRNVLISPHVGGNTSAFPPRAARLVADQLRRYVDGEPLHNVVTGDY